MKNCILVAFVAVCWSAFAVPRAEWVNGGSNSGRFGFDWNSAGVTGLNLAGCPQGPRRDFTKLKAHRNEIADGAYVIVPLCPFTSVLQKSYDDRPSVDTNPLLDFDGEPSEAELVKFRDFLDGIWKREFSIRDYADDMTATNRAAYTEMVEFMKEFIGWCRKEKLNPIFVLPPAAKCFDTLFPDSFLKAYIYDYVKDVGGDVPFFDYWKSPDFRSNRLYANALFLNRTGRKAFTARVMADIKAGISRKREIH